MKSNSTSGQSAAYIPKYIRIPDISAANFEAQNDDAKYKPIKLFWAES